MRHATNFFPTVMVAIEHIVVLLPIFCDGSNDINLKATTIVRLILLGSDRVMIFASKSFRSHDSKTRRRVLKVLQWARHVYDYIDIVLFDDLKAVRVSKLPLIPVRLSFVYIHTW